MEPDDGPGRLTPVTALTHGTDGAHTSHDRLLVARFATGDALAADEAATVRALLAACSGCDALVGDLKAVQHATASSLAPRRPRDFFLTTEQAETLRPNAWQRLLARLSAPKAGALRPLAGATLAIGIVFVGASAVMPRGETVMVQEPAPVANGTFLAPEMQNGGGNIAGTGPAAGSHDPGARQFDQTNLMKASPAADGAYSLQAGPSPGTDSSTMESAPGASSDPRLLATVPDASLRPAPESSAVTADIRVATTAAPVGEEHDGSSPASAARVPSDGSGSALLILGLLLAAVSILVLVLTWLARRTIDPLLR